MTLTAKNGSGFSFQVTSFAIAMKGLAQPIIRTAFAVVMAIDTTKIFRGLILGALAIFINMMTLYAVVDAAVLIVDIMFKDGWRSNGFGKIRVVDHTHIFLGNPLPNHNTENHHKDGVC
jgi:hypothetical protein